jgi:hypothetical protein
MGSSRKEKSKAYVRVRPTVGTAAYVYPARKLARGTTTARPVGTARVWGLPVGSAAPGQPVSAHAVEVATATTPTGVHWPVVALEEAAPSRHVLLSAPSGVSTAPMGTTRPTTAPPLAAGARGKARVGLPPSGGEYSSSATSATARGPATVAAASTRPPPPAEGCRSAADKPAAAVTTPAKPAGAEAGAGKPRVRLRAEAARVDTEGAALQRKHPDGARAGAPCLEPGWAQRRRKAGS